VTSRDERIGRNEALFREVNERIEAMHEAMESPVSDADFLCECGSAACTEHIHMSLAEYEAVRSDKTTFAVVSGHEEPSVEVVVERRPGYDVVRKLPGTPAEIAANESPR
jgi:hypothetical protein